MAAFWVLLIATGVFAVAAAVFLAIERARERHKQEMRDLVRGRKPSQPQNPFENSEKAEAAAATVRRTYPPLANANPLAPVDESMVSRAEQLQRKLLAELTIPPERPATPLSANASRPSHDDEAMVSRAEQLHKELLAEVDAANRGPATRSRKPGPCTLLIHYVDADGVLTIRNVSPYKSGHTNEKMEAWCELRQERRTFFFNRIRYAVHSMTGQQMDHADVFRLIHPERRLPENLTHN